MASSNGRLAPPAPDFDLELDRYVGAFEAAARVRDADLADFLPPATHPKYHDVLLELVRADLEFRWERGECPRAEDYRRRFPALFARPEWVRQVAAEEFRLRRAAGDTPDPIEYRDRLNVDLLGSEPARTTATAVPSADWSGETMPGVGDTIPPGFTLEEELGAGAFGRVFLARQADLASRAVAVKLSAKLVQESQTLARLQHTNIVPVYSVHRVGRFHALVMPFLGRATLADLIRSFDRSGGPPASGMAVLSTLAARASTAGGDSALAGRATAPVTAVGLSSATLERLGRFSFADAVLWIGAELAGGLVHAHERGILHRDIKPANVLLTDDGRPMLLDFNLAADANEPPTGGLAGTLRYMAPEQLAAMKANRGEFSTRTDVYALGLVLAELLAGELPVDDPMTLPGDLLSAMIAGRSRPLDPARLPRAVTPAVASILAKCLAPNPADRYASAADLREDLVRQLENRPLKFAPNVSVRERLRKWAKRHPRLSSGTTLGLVAAVILAAVTGAFLIRQRHVDTLEAERARDDLRAAVGRAYLADGPTGELQDVRATLAVALTPFQNDGLTRRLSDGDRKAVRQDAAMGMAMAAVLSDRLARREADATRRAALADEARAWGERAQRAADTGGESALEALHGGRLKEKAAQLRREVRTGEPRFATWMTLGLVEARLGRHLSAAEAFTAAIGANPTVAWPHFHRGVARLEGKAFADAEADFDHFLELAVDDPDGLFNRGLARWERKNWKGAITDFDATERLGLKPNRLYLLRAEARAALGDADGAKADRKAALAIEPADPRGWAVRGEMKAASDPKGALADFDAALALDPDFLPALRDRASVLAEQLGRPADAVASLDRVLGLNPDSADDRAARAVLLARLGKKAEARADADLAAASDNPLTLYQAASAVLLAAERPEHTARGLALLRAVLRKDPAWAKVMPTDPDLKGVHADKAFRELVAAAGVLAKP